MKVDGAQCWRWGRGLLLSEVAPLVCFGTGRDGMHPGTSWERCSDCELRMLVRREPGGSSGGGGCGTG